MVSNSAIAEIQRLVEHHVSVANKLREVLTFLASDPSASFIPAPTSEPTSTSDGQSLVPIAGMSNLRGSTDMADNALAILRADNRETRINALEGVEFRGIKYNDAVVAALDIWGPEKPRPRRNDIIRIMQKGGFDHPNGNDGIRATIRNAAASEGNPVIRLSNNDVDGEYALKTWFGAQPQGLSRRRTSSRPKEISGSDLLPDEQTEVAPG